MKTIILSALYIASVLSKGPCDQKLECYQRVFDTDDRALCTGFRGCLKAEFGTTSFNPICSGHESCLAAKVNEAPPKFICNGFQSCKGAKGINANEKIACNGLKSCREIPGFIRAPVVCCDGDISCNNEKIVASGTDTKITCNGNKACVDANLISDDRIDCDGDMACKDARLAASEIGCGGKRSCYGARIPGPNKVYAYGFNAAANSVIAGPSTGDLEIRALGMNALLDGDVNTNGADTTILGYGYRSLVDAAISCVDGSSCKVTCRMNACKGADILVDATSSLTMDPPECDPRDANYVGPSKKDPTLPGKAFGINCPAIRGPGVIATEQKTIDQLYEEFDKIRKQDIDYLEMIESAEIAEKALDAMIQERVDGYEKNLDLTPLPEDEELMVVGHTISTSTESNNILTSNLLTALVVFIMTSVGSLCYIAYKFGGNGETKALLQ